MFGNSLLKLTDAAYQKYCWLLFMSVETSLINREREWKREGGGRDSTLNNKQQLKEAASLISLT